ncbi:MAG TPA: GNAT family N-acetyltransferase [Nitrososphaerales archaeon]|nr:GNAT family N-acetyltransferase [Nitrososphaerales archaeon]
MELEIVIPNMPNSEYKIRRTTRKDIDILVTHRRKMWEEINQRNGHRKLRIYDKPYQKWITEMIGRRKFIGLAAFSAEGRIVGSGGIWLRQIHPRPGQTNSEEPYLLSMYTEPEFRGTGVASSIVKEAMKRCKKKGYRSVRLHASKMARRVYSKLGWERTWEMRARI